MKRLFLIGGTMGVGKTTVSKELAEKLPNSVFLDGDWCWDAHPFIANDETKEMVMQNICFLLKQFLECTVYENIVFCWVMHEQSIIDEITASLNTFECEIYTISLMCSLDTLRKRVLKDVAEGKRTPDSLMRSEERLILYEELDTVKIITDGKSIDNIANEISSITEH